MTDDRKVPPHNKSPNVRGNQSMTQNHREKPKIGAGSYSDVTFFTVCNDKCFPGLVGLLNSLRLMDHKHPLVVGDCGLTQRQRDLLAPFCTIYQLPGDLVRNPLLFKAFPYLLEPRGTVVIIDSDMIVTRPLGALLACAAKAKSVFSLTRRKIAGFPSGNRSSVYPLYFGARPMPALACGLLHVALANAPRAMVESLPANLHPSNRL
jgi:hypothetical protein